MLTVVALLSLIAGVVLVGVGVAAILPTLSGVLGGAILILLSLFVFISLYKKIRKVYQVPVEPISESVPVEPISESILKDQSVIDEEICVWINNQIAVQREKQRSYWVQESPEFTQVGEKFSLADARNEALKHALADLNLFFQSRAELVSFKNWGCSSMEKITEQQEVWVRCIVGSYALLKDSLECLLPRLMYSLFWGLLHQIKYSPWIEARHKESLDFVKTQDYASLEKQVTFAYTRTHYHDGGMVFYREIPRFMLGSYLALRKDVDAGFFFEEGHPCYVARQAFNSGIRLYRKLFDIEDLTILFEQRNYDPEHQQGLKSLIDWMKCEDHGPDFLRQHGGSDYPTSGHTGMFFKHS
ncbi:hypothetical protein X556_0972 [Chlamydia pneumoniae B21]|nr:hypothetical protein X556_0972 [Chlamydia pneumoniae B21]